MKLKDYKKLYCPNCHKSGIVPVGEVEFGVNDINDGGNGQRRAFQVFEHPGCELPGNFKRWTYNVLEEE